MFYVDVVIHFECILSHAKYYVDIYVYYMRLSMNGVIEMEKDDDDNDIEKFLTIKEDV